MGFMAKFGKKKWWEASECDLYEQQEVELRFSFRALAFSCQQKMMNSRGVDKEEQWLVEKQLQAKS